MEEGVFEKGAKNGYCRVIYANDGSCEVGHFEKDKPHGKYCKYSIGGD